MGEIISDSLHAKIPLTSLPKQANQLYVIVAATLEAKYSNIHLMSFYSLFIQTFECLVCSQKWFRCLFYSLLDLKDPTHLCNLLQGEVGGKRWGQTPFLDQGFLKNQNIKIIVKSFCHKVRRSCKGPDSSILCTTARAGPSDCSIFPPTGSSLLCRNGWSCAEQLQLS